MANMSYCRYENTYHALIDCLHALKKRDFEDLSETEQKYRNKLVELCGTINERFEVEVIELEEEN